MTATLKWGILGTGSIARAFAENLGRSRTGQLLAVASRTQETADRFGDALGVPRRYGSYEALLADAEVQAVYISTPHPMHAKWTVRAAEARKHILCEKPLAMNEAEARRMVESARRADVFLMEAFMYRCHPQTVRLVELVRSGAIGQVRVIRATFSFHTDAGPESRLTNKALGGGGILDVGCYAVSMVRLMAGAALGEPFAEPTDLAGFGYLGPTGVDEWAVASMRFPGDILAQVSAGMRVEQDNAVYIFGSKGSLMVANPWTPGGTTQIVIRRSGQQKPQTIRITTKRWLYAIEADTVAANLERRQAPAMSWDDSLGNARTLDRWRAAIGLKYDADGA
jgi:predicted dehydrogenase